MKGKRGLRLVADEVNVTQNCVIVFLTSPKEAWLSLDRNMYTYTGVKTHTRAYSSPLGLLLYFGMWLKAECPKREKQKRDKLFCHIVCNDYLLPKKSSFDLTNSMLHLEWRHSS